MGFLMQLTGQDPSAEQESAEFAPYKHLPLEVVQDTNPEILIPASASWKRWIPPLQSDCCIGGNTPCLGNTAKILQNTRVCVF